MSATLEAVCVVHRNVDDPGGSMGVTSIDKRPADSEVVLTFTGLAGDMQQDRTVHGGPDKALYAYAAEDRLWWGEQIERDLNPGVFGENLVTRGVDVTGAVIGEVWQVGEVVVQVSMPREPCSTFQRWMQEPQWVKRFTEAGRPGAYMRVLVEGVVRSGDLIEVTEVPDHGVTVGEVFAGRRGDTAQLQKLLDGGRYLCPSLIGVLEREIRVG
jgi:MOSC domain-containing protein YiiM